MAHRSDPRLRVLHSLRLKGFADAAGVAAGSGLEQPAAAAELEGLVSEGMAVRRGGSRPGWSLTTAGRREHGVLATADLQAAGCRPAVQDAYLAFMRINPELLATCTAWQLREMNGRQVPNDHSDPPYDGAVVARLRRVDETFRPQCDELAGCMERFSGYSPRLAWALACIEAGKAEWFTRPDLDSYHSVWFELHEDLLATLGLERGAEAEWLLTRSRP